MSNKHIKDFIAKYGDLKLLEGNHYKGSLWLEDNQLTEVSFPEGMTIGGDLRLEDKIRSNFDAVNHIVPKPLMWEWRGRQYIKADGIFQQLVKRKGNVCHVKSIGSERITYLVTDGNGKWTHGDTIKEAKADLIYKIGNRARGSGVQIPHPPQTNRN